MTSQAWMLMHRELLHPRGSFQGLHSGFSLVSVKHVLNLFCLLPTRPHPTGRIGSAIQRLAA
eukprot:8593384-Heterocapsa_arctica.AAC.1